MVRYDFESLIIHDANARAVRMCQSVAERRSACAQPILIYGERGSGKTHLLCATANHARAMSGSVALYGITPKNFPPQVRRVAADASSIRNGHSAILLVDDFDAITESPKELEAIIRAFVASRQPVILCSTLRPDELRNVTAGLRSILERGEIIEVRPRPRAVSRDSRQDNAAAAALRAELEAERSRNAALSEAAQALRGQLSASETDAARAHSETSALVQRVEELLATIAAEQECATRLEAQCREQNRELEVLRRQRQTNAAAVAAAEGLARQLQAELTDAVAERGHMESFLQHAFAQYTEVCDRLELAQAEREAMTATAEMVRTGQDGLRVKLEQALASYAALQAQISRIQAGASADAEAGRVQTAQFAAVAQRKVRALHAQMDALASHREALTESTRRLREASQASREEAVQVRGEVEALAQRCASALDALVTEQARVLQLEREREERFGEIEELRRRHDELAAEAAAANVRAAHLQTETEAAIAERDALRSRLDAATARQDAALRLLAETQAEREAAIRQQAEAIETEIASLQSDKAALTETIRQLREQLRTAHRETGDARNEIDGMVQRAELLLSTLADARMRVTQLEEAHARDVDAIETLQEQQARLIAEAEARGQAFHTAIDETPSAVRDAGRPAPALGADAAPERAPDGRIAASAVGPDGAKRRLGEILCATGHITQAQLTEALERQQEPRRRKLGRVLVESGYASDELVTETVAAQLGLPFMRLQGRPLHASAVRRFSGKLARLHQCMPVHATDEELTLAMCEPLDLIAIDEVERVTNLRVKVVVTPKVDIEEAQELYYAA